MYHFGQALITDLHFLDHMKHGIPVQVYCRKQHVDIGFVQGVTQNYIKVGTYYYSRDLYSFISRPGY